MAVEYAVWLCDDDGTRIRPLDQNLVSVDYTKIINGVGRFLITYGSTLDPELLRVDRQIQILRRPRYQDKMALDFVGFLRYWERRYEADTSLFILMGPDQNDILRRRIIAYAAGTANAQLSAVAADDGLKDIFNANYIGGAKTARDISGVAGGVTVQADATAGPAITKGFSWRDAYKTMLDVAEAARTAGTPVYYELAVNDVDEDTGIISFEFRTTAGLPGLDLTEDGGLPPVIFGSGFGNVTRAVLSYDYEDEYNYVYAGGQGEGPKRYIAESSDTGRINASAWNRREVFVDARNEETDSAVDDIADAKLAESRPRIRFDATLQDSEQARYGIDWNLGDKVTIREFGQQFDGLICKLRVRYSDEERIDVDVVDENV